MTYPVTAIPGNGRGQKHDDHLAGANMSREREALTRATIEARTAMEVTMFAAAVAAERARSLSVVLEAALAELTLPEASPGGPTTRAPQATSVMDALSPREREVLALVAAGHSNKVIADELYVSPNTIKTHVASLLTKLHADSRIQLAVIAARQWCGRTTWPNGSERDAA